MILVVDPHIKHNLRQKALKDFAIQTYEGFFFSLWQLEVTNIQANWGTDIQLVPCPDSDAPKTLCQRHVSEGKTLKISLQIMNMVGREVGKPS